MKFLLYDVETANPKTGSICAIGWGLVEDMELVNRGYTLINPNAPFHWANVRVHGIHEKDVRDAPTFAAYWSETLGHLMGKRGVVVVSHNAAFDISATEQALADAGIEDPGIRYMDFIEIVRDFVPLEKYRLENLAAWAGVSFEHHRACDDACVMLDIVKAICERHGIGCFEDLVLLSGARHQHSKRNHYEPSTGETVEREEKGIRIPVRRKERCTEDVQVCDDSLAGCSFCVTGDIPDMGRDEVERAIKEHGGAFKTAVSKKTTFLVVGEYPEYGEGYISGKQKKALELIDQGAGVAILSAADFLALLRDPLSNARVCAVREAQRAAEEAEAQKERERAEKEAARAARKAEKEARAAERKPQGRPVLREE